VKEITYTNPVYPHYFADPFVWKHEGTYYAIGTGADEAAGHVHDRVFPLLKSPDLVHWEEAGRALERLDPRFGDTYWAPEVAYHDGKFYLYYSVGHSDKEHQLRVAASAEPLGPYRDIAGPLIDPEECPFAIDAHPFQDDDSQWYLFYARDFLEIDQGRAGTALTVSKLETMTRLARDWKVVLRARFDWQRFLRDRPMYGGVYDWHTLEGPCVRKHDGRYYCFYSGGRWETEIYGVDYGIADSPMGSYIDTGLPSGPRALRTAPGRALGPGHNSIITGPDGKTDFMVYHAWDPGMKARRLFIDPIEWTSEGPRVRGPTTTPQRLVVSATK
jgi:beta-xylosidase